MLEKTGLIKRDCSEIKDNIENLKEYINELNLVDPTDELELYNDFNIENELIINENNNSQKI